MSSPALPLSPSTDTTRSRSPTAPRQRAQVPGSGAHLTVHTAGALNWKGASTLQPTTLRKLDIHTPESRRGPYVTVDTESNPEGIRPNTPLSEGNPQGRSRFRTRQRFLERDTRSTGNTRVKRYTRLFRIRDARASTDTINRTERQPKERERVFGSHASDQEVVPRTHEDRATQQHSQGPGFRAGALTVWPGGWGIVRTLEG